MSLILRRSKTVWLLSCRSRAIVYNLQSRHQYLQIPHNIKSTLKPTFSWGCPRSIQTSGQLLNTLEEKADSERNSAGDRENSLQWLDRELYKLDSEVRRMGRISQPAVEKMLGIVRTTTDRITGTQALLIIRCCGSFLAEMSGKERNEVLQNVWNTVLTQRCLLDISHYNALLKMYLENDYSYDPLEILTILEQKNLEPDRITYHRLISRYCKDGDIGGASKILEFMKSKDMPINENIFNDLILGHAVSNNMEDALKIIDVMRNAGLPPNSSTYCILACGYAIAGDIEKVLSTIEEANSGDAYLTDKDILDIIFRLTITNHEDLVEQVLPKLPIKSGYSFKCAPVVMNLINRGHHKIAFELLKTMPTGHLPDGTSSPSGMFFIKQLVRSGLPKETILYYCNELQDSGKNETALLKATECLLLQGKPDEALSFLKELHSQKTQLRPHYFWPILISRKGRDKDLYEVLKIMLDLNCPANLDTLIDYTLPHISSSDPIAVVQAMKEVGYDVNVVVNAMTLYYLVRGDSKIAANILERYPVNIITSRITAPSLSRSYVRSRDAFSITQILQHMKSNPVPQTRKVETDLYGHFLQDLTCKPEIEDSLLENVLKEMVKKDMKISDVSAEVVSNKFGNNPNITSLVGKLVSSDVPALSIGESNQTGNHIAVMSIEELEALLIVKKSKGQRLVDILHKLIMLHSRNRNLERVEELTKELDACGFVYHGQMYSVLMELYRCHEQLDKAMHYKRLLNEQHPNFHPDDHKIINLAFLLAKNKKYEDAEKVIVDHYEKFGQANENGTIKGNIKMLLDELSCTGDVQLTKKFFDLLLSYDCFVPENTVLGPLINVHLVNNDKEGAVNEFLRIIKTFGFTPMKRDLFNLLIQQDDTERLQAVIDASVSVHGEESVLAELACSFIDNGRLRQARKLLESPGFRLTNYMVTNLCGRYLFRNQISELETFVNITKGLSGLDRNSMYFSLLKGYVQAENVSKAMNVWEMMQEDNVFPSEQFLHLLGTFLQKMQQPVPFEIPECTDYSLVSTFGKIVKTNNLTGILDSKQRWRFENGSLSVADMSQLVQSLINQKRITDALKLTEEMLASGTYPNLPVLRVLGNRLADSGNRTALMSLQHKMPAVIAEKVPFEDYIANSYIKKGQGEVFLNSLENEMFKYKRIFPGGGLLSLLQNSPHLLPRVKAMVELYYRDGEAKPRNMVWLHLMKTHQFEEAMKLLNETPEMHTRILLRDIVNQIRGTNDEILAKELLKQVKSLPELHVVVKGIVYAAHINVLTTLNKLDAAVELVQEAQSNLGSGSVNANTLHRLQGKLQEAGKKIPFFVPQKSQGKSRHSEDERY